MFILKSGECGQICRKRVEEILKQMEANDARAICVLGCCYHQGVGELQHDDERAIELWKQAANWDSVRLIIGWVKCIVLKG